MNGMELRSCISPSSGSTKPSIRIIIYTYNAHAGGAMRVKSIRQRSFQDVFSKSRAGRELAAISTLLDEAPEVLELVHRDLTAEVSAGAGRVGMTAEQMFRCAVLKHLQGFTYEDLELFLQDSWSIRAFARMRPDQEPTTTTLQANIARIRPENWGSSIGCSSGSPRGRRSRRGARCASTRRWRRRTSTTPPTDL